LRLKKFKLLKSFRRYLPMPRLLEGELFLYYTVQANPDKLPNHRLDTDGEAPPVRRTVTRGSTEFNLFGDYSGSLDL